MSQGDDPGSLVVDGMAPWWVCSSPDLSRAQFQPNPAGAGLSTGRSVSQTESQGASLIEKASAVKREHQAELLSKANVVGVGIGYRTSGGQRTDDIALVVMVSKKVPSIQLASQDVLPDEIDGIPVDV
jgi:hypothetical protein